MEAATLTPSVAVVGAGPAGLFAAQQLRRLVRSASIDIIDRLPVPFGLIRYGVAPDHQGTKAVARQFTRLFEREGAAFFGHVNVGADVTLDELSELYDATIVAVGMARDRRLCIRGDELPGVYGSGFVTRWFNSHPDVEARCPAFGNQVVIVGNGNVALDIARLLVKAPAELGGSDLHPDRLADLDAQDVREVTVVGRGGPHAVRFDAALIKELVGLSQVRVKVDWPSGGNAAPSLAPGASMSSEQSARLAALHVIDGIGDTRSRRCLRFRFGLTPVAVIGDTCVEAVDFAGLDGRVIRLPATALITAIGFENDADTPTATTPRLAGTLPRELGRGLYATGWFRQGPVGTIADNRLDALATAQAAAQALAQPGPNKAGRTGLARLLRERGVQTVDYAGWLRIRDQEEAAGGGAQPRRQAPRTDVLLAQAASMAAGQSG